MNSPDHHRTTVLRNRLRVRGIVQGVGFRPFVYRLATECGLTGFVLNDAAGVLIEIEGAPGPLGEFKERIAAEVPVAARIESVESEAVQCCGTASFEIRASSSDTPASTLISPDIAVCDDCLREMYDPGDRRYCYPFINCTNCGPRFTIVEEIPYDRPLTSMAPFRMCPECAREYADPADRRFHAQPNACPACGPKLTLRNAQGVIDVDDPAAATADLLRQGRIVAIRGLGGFHLAVDAVNDDAVRLLRLRKGRAEKPLALMARDIAMIREYCEVSDQEASLLASPMRPIVLLVMKTQVGVASSVAPGQEYLGFMLPYTPLHYLLMDEVRRPLVMTSGNLSEEPIAIGNDEALQRLASLADYFLLHDREILQRCDDSIARLAGGTVRNIRRSRGYVPRPVNAPTSFKVPLLAVGGELKNTIALARDRHVFLSQHIGDLDNPEAYRFFKGCIGHLGRILQLEPQAIACDLHPGYLSTQWAARQTKLPVVAVQHHHAHLAAVMAENAVTEKCLGIILDGTGYGLDGTIWGGELLLGDFRNFERLAWIEPVVMPGGEAAIKEPWRMAVSWLYKTYGAEFENLDIPVVDRIDKDRRALVTQMIDKGLNSPLTSSCGRLFDAVAALLDLGDKVNYEAQAAISLEMAVDGAESQLYDSAIDQPGLGASRATGIIRAVVEDITEGVPTARIAARFHRTLAEVWARAAKRAREKYGVNTVGLSGGVYQNKFFFELMLNLLEGAGFRVLTHSQVPTNDGGLALGQAVVANAHLMDSEGGSR